MNEQEREDMPGFRDSLYSYEIFQSSDKGKDELLRHGQAHLRRNMLFSEKCIAESGLEWCTVHLNINQINTPKKKKKYSHIGRIVAE